MANGTIEVTLKYVQNQLDISARGVQQGTNVLICKFHTPRATQMTPGGAGGNIKVTKGGEHATDYEGVLSTVAGDFTHSGKNFATGQTITVKFGPTGVNLAADTDYFFNVKNVTGVPDLVTDVSLSAR